MKKRESSVYTQEGSNTLLKQMEGNVAGFMEKKKFEQWLINEFGTKINNISGNKTVNLFGISEELNSTTSNMGEEQK